MSIRCTDQVTFYPEPRPETQASAMIILRFPKTHSSGVDVRHFQWMDGQSSREQFSDIIRASADSDRNVTATLAFTKREPFCGEYDYGNLFTKEHTLFSKEHTAHQEGSVDQILETFNNVLAHYSKTGVYYWKCKE